MNPAFEAEKQAALALSVVEYAIIIEARVQVARVQYGGVPDLTRLTQLVSDRDEAQQRHIHTIKAYRLAVADMVAGFDANRAACDA